MMSRGRGLSAAGGVCADERGKVGGPGPPDMGDSRIEPEHMVLISRG